MVHFQVEFVNRFYRGHQDTHSGGALGPGFTHLRVWLILYDTLPCYVIKLRKVVVTALRADSFYTLTMVMPVIAVTIMSTMGMLLPANSGEKMGLQITLLLTLVVFIQEGFQIDAN